MSYTLTMNIAGFTPFAVESISFGVQNAETNGSGGTGVGKATVSALTITKMLDVNSPKLYRLAFLGAHIATATLSLMMAGSTAPDASYSLTEVFVSSVTDSGSGHGGTFPMEQVTLTFSAIQIVVANAEVTLDVKKNTVS